ncbi:hypothetical protein QM012_002319 [Aureobasidium pullulans]|uniref:Uncharacterized protein n=1 Tax=Aureobasidium pullulans TaxID=5580 RepID=A0ABR0TBP8_AURPU
MVNGRGMYLRDDGRTKQGKLVTPDDPDAAPQSAAVAASAPGGVYDPSLPIAPLHLWRGFNGPSAFTPINVSGTPFPWTSSASESTPARWQDFMPKSSSKSLSLASRQPLSSSATNDDGNEEKDVEDEEDEGDGEDEEEAYNQTANDKKAS